MTDHRPSRSRRADRCPTRPSTTRASSGASTRPSRSAYFWVRFDGEPTPFEPGQYMTIGVMVDGQDRPATVLGRVAARRSPATEGYEFYVRHVQGGTFTPLLCRAAGRPRGCG